MGLYTHPNARGLMSTGLAAIAYGVLFGFLRRDPVALIAGVETCFHAGTAFKSCVRNLDKRDKEAVVILLSLVGFAVVFGLMEFVTIIISAHCHRHGRAMEYLNKVIGTLAFASFFDTISYIVCTAICHKYGQKDSDGASATSNGTNAYIIANYTGITMVCLGFAWITTIAIGSPMAEHNRCILSLTVLVLNGCILFFILAIVMGMDTAHLLRDLPNYRYKAKEMGCTTSFVAVVAYMITFAIGISCNTDRGQKGKSKHISLRYQHYQQCQ